MQVQKRNTSEFVKVKLEDEEIQATPSHLFYTNGQWELAGNLKSGDILTSANREEKKVISLENYLAKEPEAIYNFSVDEYHTYFVSSQAVLVHNMGCTPKEVAKVKAGEVVKTGLDDYYNALKNGDIEIIDPTTGKLYKSNKIAAAIDINASEVDNINIGFNGAMGKYNPSVDADFIVNLNEDIAKLNKRARTDYTVKLYSQNSLKNLYDNKVIDDLFDKNIDYYKSIGVMKESLIEEMNKFREMLRQSNEYVKANGIPIKDINANIIGYTLESTGWRVENCAEVWAVRNAILKGAKIDNIVLRTIEYSEGKFAPLCEQCEQTFKEFIESGRIISD